MSSLLIQPTQTAHWYALVTHAQAETSLQLSEELESYLVFLLMRFSRKPEVTLNVIALEFLRSLQDLSAVHEVRLKELGDQCLLFAGMFPGLTRKRRVHDNYYAEMGQSAYSILANISHQENSRLYHGLGEHFMVLRDLLRAMRPNVRILVPEYSDSVIFHRH